MTLTGMNNTMTRPCTYTTGYPFQGIVAQPFDFITVCNNNHNNHSNQCGIVSNNRENVFQLFFVSRKKSKSAVERDF
jgi:hypothetical protein